MSMKKIIFLIAIALLILNLFFFLTLFNNKKENLNIVEINDIVQSISEQWDTLGEDELPGLQYGLDYVVLDHNHQIIAATRSGLNTNLQKAISNRDTIVDIQRDNVLLGKLIIYNNSINIWQENKLFLFTYMMISFSFMGLLSFLYSIYINRSIVRPFRKLKVFSKLVAEGNLDLPLEMDKGNYFGAFTESFDIMREELKKARENERKANQSKKELVASLSHDIKTPVASIKAVSEIMQAKSRDEDERKKLEIINTKADQINTLITNMFHATLEELQELKVTVTEESSRVIYDFIKEADYNQQVTITRKDECIVFMDPLRLSQVIDNVISNSYKYAGTSISVAITIVGKYLEVSFKDYGFGVPGDELPLIFNKYYRANNSGGKSGTGLGLYISKYLIKQMQGDIECENTSDGFLIKFKLPIA